MIVKIQVPIATTERLPLALIYDESRAVEFQVPITSEILFIMKGRPKAFFHATSEEDGAFVVGEEVPEQNW